MVIISYIFNNFKHFNLIRVKGLLEANFESISKFSATALAKRRFALPIAPQISIYPNTYWRCERERLNIRHNVCYYLPNFAVTLSSMRHKSTKNIVNLKILQRKKKEMRKNYPRFTLRVSPSTLEKLAYIAEYHGRTKNKEIEFILKKQITEFERLYGIIETESDDLD